MGQNEFMFRGCWVIRLMDNDTENTTLECEVSRDGVSSNFHLLFLKKTVETLSNAIIDRKD